MSDETVDPHIAEPFTIEPEVAADPDEREQESAQTDRSRYGRELDADAAERHAAAEKLKDTSDPE